jgi:hypothetical protein
MDVLCRIGNEERRRERERDEESGRVNGSRGTESYVEKRYGHRCMMRMTE